MNIFSVLDSPFAFKNLKDNFILMKNQTLVKGYLVILTIIIKFDKPIKSINKNLIQWGSDWTV